MATLVLGAVGSYFLGPVGGFAGAALGGLIDNYLLFPALFPKPDLVGPRVNDLQIQVSSEGSDIKWLIGPRNRIAGTIIWLPKKEDGTVKFTEVKTEEDIGKGGGGQTVANYSYYIDLCVELNTTEALPLSKIKRIVKIMADSKVIYDDNAVPGKFEAITFYLGNQTTPDPLMESHEGAGNVPAYLKTCMVVIKQLALADYGNRIPNITFFVEQDSDVSLGEAISLIMDRAGISSVDYSTNRVSQCFKGMVVSGPQPTLDVLAPLLIGYGVNMRDTGTGFEFFSKGQEEIVSVLEQDLTASTDGSELPYRKIERSDTNGWEIPSEVVLSFISTDNNLQGGSERHQRVSFTSDGTLKMTMPVTLAPAEARAMAKSILWQAEAERVPVTLMLPYTYMAVQEGDVLSIPVNGSTLNVFAKQVTLGADYRIEVTGNLYQSRVYTQTGVSQDIDDPPGGGNIEDLRYLVFDGPPMLNEIADTYGVYFVAAREESTHTWRGGKLYSSASESSGYAEREPIRNEGVFGRVVEPLNEGPQELIWDMDSELVIECETGSPIPCSEQECLNGKNRACIVRPDGEFEIIGFQNVTGTGENQYKLTKLLRGLRGTDPFVFRHTVGATFVLMDLATVGYYNRGTAGLGTNDYYKCPAVGQQLSDVAASRVKISGRSRRPVQVGHLLLTKGIDIERSIFGDDLSLANSGSDYYVESSLPGRFFGLTVGTYIQLGGSGTSNNNQYLITGVSSDNSRIYLNASLTLPDTPPNGSFSIGIGHRRDVVISWRRRSKKSSVFPFPAPITDDETPETYTLVFRRGGPLAAVRRTVTVTGVTKYVYKHQDQVYDGFADDADDRIYVEVFMKSFQVGNGVSNFREILR